MGYNFFWSYREKTIDISGSMVLMNSGDAITKVYAFNPETFESVLLDVPGIIGTSPDIAHTSTKLWLDSDDMYSHISEWDITLNPFKATFKRKITHFDVSAGLAAIDNIYLLTTSQMFLNNGEIYKCYIAGSTATSNIPFRMAANTMATGDIVFTTNGKLIIANQTNSGSPNYKDTRYLSQYNYSNGQLEVQIPLLNLLIYGIYIYNSEIYLVSSTGDIYRIEKTSPWNLTLVGSTGYPVNGASQIPEMCNVSLIP